MTPTCRHCKSALRIEWRLIPKPIGTYSLSGFQTKVAASGIPFAICDHCGIESQGKPA